MKRGLLVLGLVVILNKWGYPADLYVPSEYETIQAATGGVE